jgi:uncharacterized repeat protein (TIGR03803 family)
MRHRNWIHGILFTTAAFIATPTSRAAVTYTVVYNFGGTAGANPIAGVILDPEGNMYGTTYNGGLGYGVVFKLSPSGTETVLYSFTGGADGGQPAAPLIRDSAGNLYGTTSAYGLCAYCGTVFKLDTTGTLTTLYSFTGGADGGYPLAGVIMDSSGNLYGTTYSGGILTGTCATIGEYPVAGCGVIFELETSGTEKVLYTMTGNTDGANAGAGVIRDSEGNIYATDEDAAKCYGCGVAFKLSATGTYTLLHEFGGGTDGFMPMASLVEDSSGNLYGSTEYGGITGGVCTSSGCGVVFEINSAGTESVLYKFTGGSDGAKLACNLIRDSAGNLYGTTYTGGSTAGNCESIGDTDIPGCGTVFKLGTTGALTVLHQFTVGGGANSAAGLTPGPGDVFYGTTEHGGTLHGGVVFKLTL